MHFVHLVSINETGKKTDWPTDPDSICYVPAKEKKYFQAEHIWAERTNWAFFLLMCWNSHIELLSFTSDFSPLPESERTERPRALRKRYILVYERNGWRLWCGEKRLTCSLPANSLVRLVCRSPQPTHRGSHFGSRKNHRKLLQSQES